MDAGKNGDRVGPTHFHPLSPPGIPVEPTNKFEADVIWIPILCQNMGSIS